MDSESEAIARQLMEIFESRSEGSESGLMVSPHIVITGGYTALRIGDDTIWDDEDENSAHENGWTVERELAHAEGNISDLVMALQALLRREGDLDG